MLPGLAMRSQLRHHGFPSHSCTLPLQPVAPVAPLQAGCFGASGGRETRPVSLDPLYGHLASQCVNVGSAA